MPSWDRDSYLRFADERTRPAMDLAAGVALDAPRRIVDLGCGPGNSTAVLAQRWPDAALTGVDSSEAMLASARRTHPQWTWMSDDIAGWRAEVPVDLVFSNAALQWVPDHDGQFPRLLEQVAAGGALAVQMPANADALPHALMRELANAPDWRTHFSTPPRTWRVHAPEHYYDLLSRRAARLDIWTTEYLHVLDDVDGIVEWYRGTGLRPWLEALPDEATRQRFLSDYRFLLIASVTQRPDGRVLFPFRRLFIVAYR